MCAEETRRAEETDHDAPKFVFICGSVGSGNTLMCSCVTRDENVYGVNEDAFGSTLQRLILSEKDIGACPHGAEAFVEFLHALRRDRRTLVMKTPSNLRRMALLREYLPGSRFIVMIREPHAAIVSGLKRHGNTRDVEAVAELWLSDSQYYKEMDDDSIMVTFEEIVRDPAAALQRVSDRILPLSADAFAYGSRVNRPERADPQWWKSKVSDQVAREIEKCVEKMGLMAVYDSVAEATGQGASAELGGDSPVSSLLKPLLTARKQFFRVWYRLTR